MDNTVEVQDLGKVMITPKGEYSSSKSYEILDAVSYNGSSYVSKINDNTSVPISDDWQLLAQKGDVYDVTEEDLQAIAKQITDNAKSAFNQNVETKTKEFNTNATNKENDYDTNAKKKLDGYNANDTKKLKAYNDNADSKLGAYNTNDTNKLKAYNTNADSKIEEYNTNATSKISEYDEHSEELRNMAVSTDNELERIKNGMLGTGSASDSFIHVEDSCMAKIKELGIDGVCKQETTRGYNILDENSWKNGYHIAGNSINTSNNGCHVDFQKIGSTTQYFIRIEALQNCRMGRFFLAFTNESQDTSIGKVSEGIYDTVFSAGQVKYITVNVPDGAFYVGFSIYLIQKIVNGEYVDAIPIYENYKDYFKICISTTYQKDYEPYTGRQPSPNPDYPQEIKTITDSLKVTSCGKNLFNGTDYSMIVNGVTISISRNRITLNGTATGAYNNSNSNYINVFPIKLAEIYSYSCTQVCGSMIGTRLAINLRGGNNVSDMSKQFNPASLELRNGSNSTSNSRIDCSYVTGLQFIFSDDAVFDNYTFDIQLERGRNVTAYEPYVESLITANLPEGEFIGKLNDTYKDTLTIEYVAEDSKCHLKLNKKVGFKNFNDVSSILYSELQGDYFLFQIMIGYLPSAVMISNNFINKTNYGLNYNYESVYRGASGNKAFQFKVKKERVASYDAAGALSFIKNSNTDVYYALNTPYTLDLGPIDMPLAYKEVTNIFTNSDLLPKINAKYYRTFETTVQNMQINEKTLKQEITDLNSSIANIIKRLEVLESNNASTVEESEASNDLQN